MKTKDDTQEFKKKFVLRLAFIIISLFILISLFYLLSEFGLNPFIIILILAFTFLIFTGPFLKRKKKKKSLYSRMFPNKHSRFRLEESKQRKDFRVKTETISPQSEKFKSINLDFKYRKPILRKCENCGMILASFVKKCPLCGKQIDYTE